MTIHPPILELTELTTGKGRLHPHDDHKICRNENRNRMAFSKKLVSRAVRANTTNVWSHRVIRLVFAIVAGFTKNRLTCMIRSIVKTFIHLSSCCHLKGPPSSPTEILCKRAPHAVRLSKP